jgi:hypothetical protein
MRRPSLSFLPALLVMAVLMTVGCSRHEHDHAAHAHHGHAHQAPHGGTLIELGDHQFNLELLHDRGAGTLTAFVLDGHAEHAVRVPANEIRLLLDREGRTEPLSLAAVANPLSGETVGDTSEFRAEAEWLKEATMVSGHIAAITVRGVTFRDVAFVLF